FRSIENQKSKINNYTGCFGAGVVHRLDEPAAISGRMLFVVNALNSITKNRPTHRPAIGYLNHVHASATCHRLTPRSRKQLIGRRYFRHVIITWSIRSRGSVQRTHICTNTSSQHLTMNTITLMTFPTHPRAVTDRSHGVTPVFQPPRNRSTAMP